MDDEDSRFDQVMTALESMSDHELISRIRLVHCLLTDLVIEMFRQR